MKKIVTVILAIVLSLSVFACSTNTETQETAEANTANEYESSSTEKTKDAEGSKDTVIDTLTVAQAADIKAIDPLIGVTTYSISVNRHLYDYLINLNEDGSFSPMLAESWELLNPNLVELKLRNDVYFHNGEKMTSADVVYSLERVRDLPLSLTQGMFGEITAVDEYTVHVELLQTFGAIELLFCRTGTQIVPKGMQDDDDTYNAFIASPIGTGPYKFVKWSKGDYIELEAFEDYWGDSPLAKHLIIRIIAEPSMRLVALENGEIDIAYDIGANDVDKINQNSELTFIEGASSRCVIVSTNYKSPSPISNKLVLQAIQYAIDKEAIVQAVGYGHGSVAHTMIPSFVFGSTDKIVTEYNIEKAKELLSLAGYPDGFEVDMATYSDQLYVETGNIIQSQLKEIGIKVNLHVSDQATLLESCGDENHGLILKFWMTVADAHNTFHPYYFSTSTPAHGNSAFYSNEDVDKYILEETNSSDSAVRQAAFDAIYDITAEELPYIPIFFTPMLVGMRANVQGFVPDPYGYHRLVQVAAHE